MQALRSTGYTVAIHALFTGALTKLRGLRPVNGHLLLCHLPGWSPGNDDVVMLPCRGPACRPLTPEPSLQGPENPGLSMAIRSFFDISRGGAPFLAPQMPPGPLSEGEAARLRNRSSILARHVFADQGEGFADAQVGCAAPGPRRCPCCRVLHMHCSGLGYQHTP